jgi:hypothetical protein
VEILSVPTDVTDENSTTVHLYDRPNMAMETVRAHVNTYIDTQGRDAQNSYMLYRMLINSLTREAKAKLRLDEPKYTVNNIQVGALLFKAIIDRNYVASTWK